MFYRAADRDKRIIANTGWVAFCDYVLVIDANFPWGARAVLDDIRKTTDKPIRFVFDTHYHSDHSFGNSVFVDAGATILTIHAEATVHLDRTLNFIRSQNVGVGVSINPATPLSVVEHALGLADMLLIMTVNPGFGGQSFIYETLPKIQEAAHWRAQKNLSYNIGVDGGVDFKTVGDCAHAGADAFISGTALFHLRSMKAGVKKMRKIAEAARPEAADATRVTTYEF